LHGSAPKHMQLMLRKSVPLGLTRQKKETKRFGHIKLARHFAESFVIALKSLDMSECMKAGKCGLTGYSQVLGNWAYLLLIFFVCIWFERCGGLWGVAAGKKHNK